MSIINKTAGSSVRPERSGNNRKVGAFKSTPAEYGTGKHLMIRPNPVKLRLDQLDIPVPFIVKAFASRTSSFGSRANSHFTRRTCVHVCREGHYLACSPFPAFLQLNPFKEN